MRLPLRTRSDLASVFQTAARKRVQATVVFEDVWLTNHRVELVRTAMSHSLPVVSLYKDFPEAGGLFAYWGESRCHIPAHSVLRGQNSQRGEALRAAHRATDEVRLHHQPQGRQGPRPHDPALAAAAGGSRDRVRRGVVCGVVWVEPRVSFSDLMFDQLRDPVLRGIQSPVRLRDR